MAMTNRERQAKWRARARAALRDRGDDEHMNLFAEQVELRAKRWRGRHDLEDIAKEIEQFYLACAVRQKFLAEELAKNWDEERAHDVSQVQLASEEALIDLAAVKECIKEGKN